MNVVTATPETPLQKVMAKKAEKQTKGEYTSAADVLKDLGVFGG